MNEFASERANSSEKFTATGLLNLWVQALLGAQVRELQPACESFGGCFPGASIFSSPGRSPGRAIVLSGGGGGVSKKFNIKVSCVMGKALSGELSCPCDRSCFPTSQFSIFESQSLSQTTEISK